MRRHSIYMQHSEVVVREHEVGGKKACGLHYFEDF